MAYPFSFDQDEVDNLFYEEQTYLGAWDQQYCQHACTDGVDSGPNKFFEFEQSSLSRQMHFSTTTSLHFHELNDFEEDISSYLGLWDFDQSQFQNDVDLINPNPITCAHNNYATTGQNENVNIFTAGMYKPSHDSVMNVTPHGEEELELSDIRRNKKSSELQLEEIQKHFDVPISRAAKELNVGLTVLKKRCRELNIARWPHRKIKSLKSLIHNAKELGLCNEIEMLEEHKRMVEQIPEMELTERTKKLRQACFKANYKRRKSTQQQPRLT